MGKTGDKIFTMTKHVICSTASLLLFFILLFVASGFAGQKEARGFLDEATAHYNNGDYNAAIASYNKAVANGGSKAIIYFNMANCSYLLNKPWDSVKYFLRVMELAPNFNKSYLNCAKVYMELKEYTAAIPVLDKLLAIEPDNWEAMLLLGSCYCEMDMLSVGIRMLDRSLEANPDNLTAFILLSEAYVNLGDEKEALRIMERALAMNPDSSAAMRFLADLYMSQERYGEAIALYDSIISSKPQEYQAYYRLAECYSLNEQNFCAVDILQSLLAKKKDDVSAMLLLAKLYLDLEFYDDAEKVIFEAAAYDARRARVPLHNLAAAYYNSDQDDKIKSMYDIAAGLDPALAALLRDMLR